MRIFALIICMYSLSIFSLIECKSLRRELNPKCPDKEFMTISPEYSSEIHECTKCEGILDVLVIVTEKETRYGHTFTQIEKLCFNYILHGIALVNISISEVIKNIERTREQQYLGSLDEYEVDIQWACNESSSYCGEVVGDGHKILDKCKEGFEGVYIPLGGGRGNKLIKCIQDCHYGLFIPIPGGGCYPGYCENSREVLTLSMKHAADWEIDVCQFGEKHYSERVKSSSGPNWTFLEGKCTECSKPGEFWAFTTFINDDLQSLETSICGTCLNWVGGMPGLLERCQKSTCICQDLEQCNQCKISTNYKFIDRDGKWKYCYEHCSGNIKAGILSFVAPGRECHLFGEVSEGLNADGEGGRKRKK